MTSDTPLPTIAEAQARFAAGEFSSVEYVELCLNQIAEVDDTIAAWVQVDAEGALVRARECDAERARGDAGGVLHGVPIGIKDIIDVQGVPTKAGSQSREQVAPAAGDAVLVGNLRRQGAIILGKTVTTEFAGFDPPPTRNPVAFDHTPGGSSSGSAAAVAAEMCPAAVGSQTGGSINRPATYCGVAGFKPPLGDVSMQGVVPISLDLDHPGPIARTVAELWTVWQAMRDTPPQELPHSNTRAELVHLGGYFDGDRCQTEVREKVLEVLEQFAELGVCTQREDLPIDLEQLVVQHRRIMARDCATLHEVAYHANPDLYGKNISQLILEGFGVTSAERAEAGEVQKRDGHSVRQWMGDRILVTAAACSLPPGPETTGDPCFNSPWSFLGLPSLSIPIGLADGLPVALQLIGQDCRQLFAVARHIELLVALAS